jgi:hypothetical protein
MVMVAKSKTLLLVLFPALLLAVFGSFSILPTHSAFAVEKSVERIGCDNGRARCERRCEATMIDVGWQIEACKRDCQVEWVKCLPLGETPEATKAPPTKVLPELQPGDAEMPKTGPKVIPKDLPELKEE